MLRIGTNFAPPAEYPPLVQQHIRTGHQPLAAWQAAGLDYIELALKSAHLDDASLSTHIEQLQHAGLGVHLHPYYEIRGFGTPSEARYLRQNLTQMLDIAHRAAQTQGYPVVINFHAASGAGTIPRETLHAQSVAFFDWLAEQATGLDVAVTVEHQLPPRPTDTWQRYGDHYTELLALHAAINQDNVRLCWDMGHSAMRSARYGDDLLPPPDFAAAVRHVHIHDVQHEIPADHRPIGDGETPLGNYLLSLAECGYAGDFTMEYDANEFFGADYTAFLTRSKAALMEILPPNWV
ncbi:MAG: sugar phosphate isomerase/epimerase family protein [Anaerolineales bacterium]